MRVLVLGGSGFVGGAIARGLLAEGHEVRVLSRGPQAVEGADAMQGDLADPRSLAAAAERCDVVVHAAGEASHRASAKALGWINVAGTENALKGARHASVRRFVYISCTDVSLSVEPRVGWNEDRFPRGGPISELGRSKLRAEEAVIGAGTTEFETVVLRPAQVWGPGDTSTLPGWAAESAMGIPLFGAGTNLIGTTYVDNLGAAVVFALQTPEAAGAVFHIVDAEMTLARDFFGDIAESLNAPAPRKGLSWRVEYARAQVRRRLRQAGPWPTDVLRRARSASFDQLRARDVLGYEPKVSQADGMKALAAWIEAQGGAKAVASAGRAPATDESVADQISAAYE
ncbi:MAG: NAD(P)-dependent oxidoreductase [Myxococcota bacterium]